jgi:protein involved in polysaccharide export with SLBB domain
MRLMNGLISLGLTLVLAACATSAPPAPAAPAAGPTPSAIIQDYKLGVGDKIRVIVFNEPNLSGEFVVTPAGTVAAPLLGEVKALGLTVNEFQSGMEKKLADGYLRSPKVSVEVLNFRPFYILGEVNKPGEYPYSSGLTVLNAVATAGGFTYRADTRKVFMRRADDAAETAVTLESRTAVAPGDTVRIGERYF